ncbi:MAG: hypothetical protein JXK05_13530 [Campylobacterales bacterium]|nr:hypothetical protein [Campylobacterales bacterium]
MHSLRLNIEDNAFDKVMYFLKNLPQDDIQIIEDEAVDNWSYLEAEIDKGLNSGISNRSHEDIVKAIKQQHA